MTTVQAANKKPSPDHKMSSILQQSNPSLVQNEERQKAKEQFMRLADGLKRKIDDLLCKVSDTSEGSNADSDNDVVILSSVGLQENLQTKTQTEKSESTVHTVARSHHLPIPAAPSPVPYSKSVSMSTSRNVESEGNQARPISNPEIPVPNSTVTNSISKPPALIQFSPTGQVLPNKLPGTSIRPPVFYKGNQFRPAPPYHYNYNTASSTNTTEGTTSMERQLPIKEDLYKSAHNPTFSTSNIPYMKRPDNINTMNQFNVQYSQARSCTTSNQQIQGQSYSTNHLNNSNPPSSYNNHYGNLQKHPTELAYFQSRPESIQSICTTEQKDLSHYELVFRQSIAKDLQHQVLNRLDSPCANQKAQIQNSSSYGSRMQIPAVTYSSPRVQELAVSHSTQQVLPIGREHITNSYILGNKDPKDILYLICKVCNLSYGSVYGFKKHFRCHHGNEPRREHVIIQTISETKAYHQTRRAQSMTIIGEMERKDVFRTAASRLPEMLLQVPRNEIHPYTPRFVKKRDKEHPDNTSMFHKFKVNTAELHQKDLPTHGQAMMHLRKPISYYSKGQKLQRKKDRHLSIPCTVCKNTFQSPTDFYEHINFCCGTVNLGMQNMLQENIDHVQKLQNNDNVQLSNAFGTSIQNMPTSSLKEKSNGDTDVVVTYDSISPSKAIDMNRYAINEDISGNEESSIAALGTESGNNNINEVDTRSPESGIYLDTDMSSAIQDASLPMSSVNQDAIFPMSTVIQDAIFPISSVSQYASLPLPNSRHAEIDSDVPGYMSNTDQNSDESVSTRTYIPHKKRKYNFDDEMETCTSPNEASVHCAIDNQDDEILKYESFLVHMANCYVPLMDVTLLYEPLLYGHTSVTITAQMKNMETEEINKRKKQLMM